MPLADWLPARYAIDAPDYDPALGTCLLISLDGVAQDNVIAYDANEGWLTRYMTDESGNIILDRLRECVLRETVYGVVSVDWRT